MQLQRLAHEELGFGTWSKTANANPATELDARLAILDISDLKHPVLKVPTADQCTSDVSSAEGKTSASVSEAMLAEEGSSTSQNSTGDTNEVRQEETVVYSSDVSNVGHGIPIDTANEVAELNEEFSTRHNSEETGEREALGERLSQQTDSTEEGMHGMQ